MSELIDLVDVHGVIRERGVSRDDTATYHEAGMHMQIVVVVVFNGLKQILIHQRAAGKSDAGKIDLICGGVQAGETPEQAAYREANEEGGVQIHELGIVCANVNEYNRFRTLFTAVSAAEPSTDLLDPTEVTWSRFYTIDELKTKQASGEFSFVGGFFTDVELALASRDA